MVIKRVHKFSTYNNIHSLLFKSLERFDELEPSKENAVKLVGVYDSICQWDFASEQQKLLVAVNFAKNK